MPGVTCYLENAHAGDHCGYREEQDEVVFWEIEPFEPSQGVRLIGAARARQMSEEGWTPAHDDEHLHGELCGAAMAYVANRDSARVDGTPPLGWPWEPSWWKPSDDTVRNLVKAGALIAAEIDRLLRAGASRPTEGEQGAKP